MDGAARHRLVRALVRRRARSAPRRSRNRRLVRRRRAWRPRLGRTWLDAGVAPTLVAAPRSGCFPPGCGTPPCTPSLFRTVTGRGRGDGARQPAARSPPGPMRLRPAMFRRPAARANFRQPRRLESRASEYHPFQRRRSIPTPSKPAPRRVVRRRHARLVSRVAPRVDRRGRCRSQGSTAGNCRSFRTLTRGSSRSAARSAQPGPSPRVRGSASSYRPRRRVRVALATSAFGRAHGSIRWVGGLVRCRLTVALVAGAVRAVHGMRRRCGPAELLRRLLGRIRLVPVVPSSGRPYYRARTALDTLELLAGSESGEDSDAGAKSSRWWTRLSVISAGRVQWRVRACVTRARATHGTGRVQRPRRTPPDPSRSLPPGR